MSRDDGIAADAVWDRTSRFVLVGLALFVVVSSFWLVHPYYEANVETNDASMYILSAQSLLRGEGYAYLGEPMIIRPPGMSLLLAPIIAWRGLDFALLNAVAAVFGIVGTLLFFVWTRPRVGPWVAAAASGCLWLNPGWRHFSNQVMSDVPGVTLLIAAFVIERWAERAPGWKRDLALGAFIGLATYMRTIAVLFLFAILLARVIERLRAREERSRPLAFVRLRLAPIAAATILVMLPWIVRNSLVAPPPPAEQNFIYSYGTGLFHANPRDPASPPRSLAQVAELVPVRAGATLEVLGSRFEGRESPLPAWMFGLWIAASIAYVLVRRARSAEIFCVLAGLVLLVYFGFRPRLVLPLYVVGLAAWAEAHVELGARWCGTRTARAVSAVTLAALALVDFQPRKDWDEISAAHTAMIEQARAWNRALGGATRLAANIGWHDSVYVGLPVWSFAFAPRKRSAEAEDVPDAERVIEKHRIEAVLVSEDPREKAWIPWLERHYGPGEPAGRGFVFRVRR